MTVTKITLYYADWCGHCKTFKPVWNELKEYVKEHNIPLKLEEYESSKDKAVVDKAGIKGYPTILVEETTKKVYEYNGERSSVKKILDHLNIQTNNSDNQNNRINQNRNTQTAHTRPLNNLGNQNGGGYLSSIAVLSHDYRHKYRKYKLKYLNLKISL